MSDITLTARRAAVAIAIQNGTDILLTRRATSLRMHGGEICFPGGHVDADDASLYETALREASEEVGLDKAAVRRAAEGPSYRTSSGCFMTAVIMDVRGGSLRLNPDEVQSACWLPLASMMNFHQYRISKYDVANDRLSYALDTKMGTVRGATCAILLEFAKLLARKGSLDSLFEADI